MGQFLKHSLRYYIYLIALCIILLAVLLQTLRVLAPQVDFIRPDVERFLSSQTGTDIRLGKMSASWYGLRPHLLIGQISLSDADGVEQLAVYKADLSLDLLESLLQRQWVWQHIAFENIKATIEQSSSGEWQVAGFPVASGTSSHWNYQNPVELFSIVPQVDITRAEIQVNLASGRSFPITIPSIKIENDNSFHRLHASAEYAGREVFSLVMEHSGGSDSSAQAYLNFDNFPLQNIFQATIDKKLLPESATHMDDSTIDMSLWFDFQNDDQFNVEGQLERLLLPALNLGGLTFPGADISASVRGGFNADSDEQIWQFGFRDITIDDSYRLDNMMLSAQSEQLELAVDQVVLEPVFTALSSMLDSDKARRVIEQLSVSGKIERVLLAVPELDFKQLTVSGNLDSVSTHPYDKVPGFTNINGYFESGLSKGFVNLEGSQFSLFPEVIYSKAIDFAQAKGQVAWSLSREKNHVIINSGLLQVEGDFGQGNGSFLLNAPWESGSRPSTLDLIIGLQNSHARYYPQLLPNILPDTLADWLSDSIQDGEVPSAGLIYRGEFSNRKKRTAQLFLDVKDSRLAYSKEWPELTNATGQVIIDNRSVKAVVTQANILDEPLDALSVRWPYGQHDTLHVLTSATVSARSGLRLLNESWLRSKVGDTFEKWEADGVLNVNAELELDFNSTGERDYSQQNVSVEFLENNINAVEQDLYIENVRGTLHFDESRGLYADDTHATLFGRPVQFNLAQRIQHKKEVIVVEGKGKVSPQKLSDWLGNSSVSLLKGVIPYNFDLMVPVDKVDPVKLKLASSLSGVNVDLPEPFGKASNKLSPLSVDATFFSNNSQRYAVKYKNNTSAEVAVTPSGVSGFLAINEPEKKVALTSGNKFIVYASLDTIDIAQWSRVLNEYQSDSSFSNSSFDQLDYQVQANNILFNDYSLQDVKIEGNAKGGRWFSTVQNNNLKGRILFDENSANPINLDFDYLNIAIDETALEESEEPEAKSNTFADTDLSKIRSADVTVQKLNYKGKKFDQLSFALRPVDQGVMLDRLTVSFSGMKLVGLGDALGAKLLWMKPKGSEGRSQFTGEVMGGDISQLFDAWSLPSNLQSESSQFQLNIGWEGSPLDFSIASLYGDVRANLEEGIFLRNQSQASTGVLRLFSLFNFDTWARRLRLDFSDLYKKGIVFDSLTTRLSFDKGNIYFQEPLYVKSTSSEFTMAGVIDYPKENIDAVLVTTLPIGGNLTFATALAAGLPAAVGVYIVGKLFKPQVDKVSSLTYSVKGDWADPNVKFMRIFDNSIEEGASRVEEIPLDDIPEDG